jgi:PBSX family phage terminase large subunit
MAKPHFSDKQYKSIVGSNSRINIWDGSVRAGKTIASIWRWLKFVKQVPPNYPLLMTGKTNRTLERNVINPIIQMVGEKRASYSAFRSEMKLFGRPIDCVAAVDESSEGKIRGSTIGGAYGDEVTLWPESFFTMLLSRMSVKGAKFFGTTNPDSPYHWLKENYLDRGGKLDLTHWHFILDDNTNLDPEYVKQIKLEYTGLWYKRFILGLWVMAEGAIYDMWDEDRNTIDVQAYLKSIGKRQFSSYFASADYGTNNPTAFGLYGYNNGKPPVYKVGEYYWDSNAKGRQKTDAEYAIDYIKFIESHGVKPSVFYVDPSAASFMAELRTRGVNPNPAANDVVDGIRFMGQMLAEGTLKIDESCKETIKEIPSYVWDAKAQKQGEDKPVKENDHCCDETRYGVYTHFFRPHAQRIIGLNRR